MHSYGGNVVRKMNTNDPSTVFSDNTYYYALLVLKPRQQRAIDSLGEYTIFLKAETESSSVDVEVDGSKFTLNGFDSMDIRGHRATVQNVSDVPAYVLVAGIKATPTDKLIHAVRKDDIKKVFKPWGHELWINTKNTNYSLKQVFLKPGRTTSLQYHRHTQETTVLVTGRANIWFKANDQVENDQVRDHDLGHVALEPVSSVDILPHTIHRLEAVTDITLYEASTPHLDDVIRLKDDSGRKSGTIESEHKLQICILTAGKGERMGGLCDMLNKALLPLRGKAVISWIIEKFPKTSKFVIALGYRGEQVKNYLLGAYPGYELEFVQVDNYDRVGAGPGYSLKQCRSVLGDKPFYFVACDTLIEEDVPYDLQENWMGVCAVNVAVSENYCNFTIENNSIVNMVDKEPYQDNHSKSFIGFSYIHDTPDFWKGLDDNYLNKGEWQMTNGIRYLIAHKAVRAVDFKWKDVGSYRQYVELVNETDRFDFSKSNEFLYIVNKRVVKFFNDAEIAINRAKRTQFNPQVFPTIDFAHGQFYAYPLVPGDTLYAKNDLQVFTDLLAWLDAEVWKQHPNVDLTSACRHFYQEKTMGRIERFFEKYPKLRNNKKLLNGRQILPLEKIFEKLDWAMLSSNHLASFIHGDLQFDNIIHSAEGFTLIDWRQDFAGLLDVGDLYYDLAKLYGGLVINYDLIKENRFVYSEDEHHINFDFFTRNSMNDYRTVLEKFILERGYNLKKVRLLVGLIFLNMAPLHHYPFDKMLFALGAKRLHEDLGT
jgi:choline kinase/mannose-6-phosphate isomerase-like protein (cupin superfamily)